MTMTPDAVPSTALDEETARSELYGLLAQVYYAPPAPEFVAELRLAATQTARCGGLGCSARRPCPKPKTILPTCVRSCVT